MDPKIDPQSNRDAEPGGARSLCGGFSLVELVVSVVIVSIVGATGWYACMALFKADEATHYQTAAVNLLRRSQEEVRRISRTHFDQLGTAGCGFTVANTCGFDNMGGAGNDGRLAEFPDFVRTLAVSNEGGSSEFKRVLITVSWNGVGGPMARRSTVLLSRPAAALPGDLIGNVTNAVTGQRIAGATLEVTRISPPKVLVTASKAADLPRADGQSVNYSFADSAGLFQIDAGTWTLKVTADGYLPYNHPAAVNIASNTEERIDVQMTPAPTPAHIRARFLNAGASVGFNPQGRVGLYRGGVLVSEKTVGTAAVVLADIPFTTSDPQCFTIATSNVYQSGFAGNFTCPGGGISQEPRGWSSSVVDNLGALACGNPWAGSPAAGVDRICVGPGEDYTQVISVVPVLTATVQGVVRDNLGNPIAGADVFIRWHDGGNYPWPNKSAIIRTDASGAYQTVVPAERELFSSGMIRVSARANNVPITRCCNVSGTTTVNSATYNVGPVVAGAVLTQDFTINTTPQVQQCGNAGGTVINTSTGSGLAGVQVTLSANRTTDAAGSYLFDCPAQPASFSVPSGNYTLNATRSGFYPFTSQGNGYYTRTGSGSVGVVANVLNSVSPVGLWPQGYGTINVRALRQGDRTPVAGAQVTLLRSGASPLVAVTDTAGQAAFSNVLETWPASGVVGNPKFNQTAVNYNLNATHPVFQDASVTGIVLGTGAVRDIEVLLAPKEGL